MTLRAGTASAEIVPRGAETRSWRIDGKSLLWRPDPAVWADVAPILFPVVGWTNRGEVRVGETIYPLGLHGFARHADFAIADQTTSSVRLTLTSNAESLALYPFEFRLHVDHALRASSFMTALIVENCGATPMPYACGLHPGFCWPFAGGDLSDYRLRFETAEDPEIPEISAKGLFRPAKRRVPLAGALLPLTADLFAAEALCFLDAASRRVRFEHRAGASIAVTVDDFPHFAFWARPPAPFLSIETWTGYGDPENFAGDLFEKPGMRILPPGGVARHAATYTYEAAADALSGAS